MKYFLFCRVCFALVRGPLIYLYSVDVVQLWLDRTRLPRHSVWLFDEARLLCLVENQPILAASSNGVRLAAIRPLYFSPRDRLYVFISSRNHLPFDTIGKCADFDSGLWLLTLLKRAGAPEPGPEGIAVTLVHLLVIRYNLLDNFILCLFWLLLPALLRLNPDNAPVRPGASEDGSLWLVALDRIYRLIVVLAVVVGSLLEQVH